MNLRRFLLCSNFIVFLFLSMTCHACKRAMIDDKPHVDPFIQADRVFLARIISTELISGNPSGNSDFETVKAKYRLIETFKGRPNKTGFLEEMVWGVGNCTLGLMTGMEYIIFQDKSTTGFLWDSSFVISPVSHDLSGDRYYNELERVRMLSGKSNHGKY